MQHSIKSLLITTVLTFPTVFGAVPEMTSTEDRHGSSSSIVDLVSEAYKHQKAGYPEVAAKVYADYAMRPDALWFNVLFATKMIEGLRCFNMAVKVFEWSQAHPKTEYFKDIAASEIARLTQVSIAIPQAREESAPEPTGVRSGAGAIADSIVGAGTSASVGNKGRYERMYAELTRTWKIAVVAENSEFFFDRGVEGSELISTAVLELMYGFLIDHPEIYVPDLENFGLFTIANYNTTTHAVTIPQVEQLKQKLLDQAFAAFAKEQRLYATIVQVGGAGSGHFTVVVIERDGNVHMINTMGAFGGDSKDDPYVHIMPKLVEALNMHKGTAPIEFKAATNVRTGIQDADALSNSCGIYSFVYWAALMKTQDIDAYKRVTAAASEGYLGDYEGILNAATHKNAMDAIVQVDDPSKANDFGIRYLKNKSAEVQARFERDVRSRLQLKLAELAS